MDQKEEFDLLKVCRGCLSNDTDLITIEREHEECKDVLQMFEICTSIQLETPEDLPLQMCESCLLRLNESYQFRHMCLESHTKICELLEKRYFFEEDKKLEQNEYKVIEGSSKSRFIEVSSKDIVNEELAKKLECLNEDTLEIITTKLDDDLYEELYECEQCFKSFDALEQLKQHFTKFHSKTVSSKTRSKERKVEEANKNVFHEPKKYKCDECEKEYTSAANLRIHMYSHKGYKPLKCSYCGKGFTKVFSLKSHEAIHTGIKSFICHDCGKQFTTNLGLKRHLMSHTGQRPFVCKYCSKSFAASGDLHVHVRVHTGERPYLCPTCGRSFSRISHVNTHMRTHTGEKPFKCNRCGKAFAQSGDLKSHIRIHTGDKPYTCKMCSKKFIQSSGLTSHMRTHLGQKLHQCRICNKSFSQAGSLSRHVRCHE